MIFTDSGRVAEWSKAAALGAVLFGGVGSNPIPLRFFFFLFFCANFDGFFRLKVHRQSPLCPEVPSRSPPLLARNRRRDACNAPCPDAAGQLRSARRFFFGFSSPCIGCNFTFLLSLTFFRDASTHGPLATRKHRGDTDSSPLWMSQSLWVLVPESGNQKKGSASPIRPEGWSWHTLAESKSAQPTRAVW